MPEPITDRAGVESVRHAAVDALQGLGYSVLYASMARNAYRDVDCATAFFANAEQIRLVGRNIFLRTACRWLGDAFDALADGRDEEAYRWAFRAAAELERFNEVTEEVRA